MSMHAGTDASIYRVFDCKNERMSVAMSIKSRAFIFNQSILRKQYILAFKKSPFYVTIYEITLTHINRFISLTCSFWSSKYISWLYV